MIDYLKLYVFPVWQLFLLLWVLTLKTCFLGLPQVPGVDRTFLITRISSNKMHCTSCLPESFLMEAEPGKEQLTDFQENQMTFTPTAEQYAPVWLLLMVQTQSFTWLEKCVFLSNIPRAISGSRQHSYKKMFAQPISFLGATNIFVNILPHILSLTKGFFNHTVKLYKYRMPPWYLCMS